MRHILLLISAILFSYNTVKAELTELVTIYGPPEGRGFYHICGPGDVNGDGYDDFIISSPERDRNVNECENGYARLYFGSSPIDTSNYITIPAVCNGYQTTFYHFGYYCKKTGDINNDGFPDFLVGDPSYDNYMPENVGAGFIYFGGLHIDTLPDWRLIGELWNSSSHFSGIGDVNGDSFNDIVSGSSLYAPGFTYIYLGGESPDSLYDFEIVNPDSFNNQDSYPKIIGDYNADGIDDFVVCDVMYMQERGIAYMYLGSETGFDEPDLILGTESTGAYGQLISECGDLNNDSFDDIMIADWHRLYIYLGSENPDSIADLIVSFEDTMLNVDFITRCGDLNRDGYDDIAVSNMWWSDIYHWQGRVLIYHGGEEMDNIPDIELIGQFEHQLLGVETAFPGDINRDGYPEFMVSSIGDSPGQSFVTIYTTGMNSAPDYGQKPSGYNIELSSYPNPFNATTNISFRLTNSGKVSVKIYSLAGKLVETLIDDYMERGSHNVTWDASAYSSGIYFCKLTARQGPGRSTAGEKVFTKRMVLLK